MSSRLRRQEPLPLGLFGRLDPVCDRFEAAWRGGGRPRREDFFPQVEEPDRPALLRELLALARAYRARLGERPTAEEYRPRLPESADLIDQIFGLIAIAPAGPTV